jgi:hypothetical protein
MTKTFPTVTLGLELIDANLLGHIGGGVMDFDAVTSDGTMLTRTSCINSTETSVNLIPFPR